MANRRMINTKIWEDAWFNDLDPTEKLLFVYLLTNPMTNILGAYELSKGTIGRATGLEKTVVEELLGRFERAEKVFYRNGWVIISNFIKHQNYKSPKIQAGMNKELENVPDHLVKLIKSPVKLYGMDTVSYIITNTKANTNNEAEDSSSAKTSKYTYEEIDLELAQYLRDLIIENTPTFKEPNIPEWAHTVRLMRKQDERDPKHIKYVIRWAQRSDFWQANILSAKKLRKQYDTLIAQIKRDALGSKKKKDSVIL